MRPNFFQIVTRATLGLTALFAPAVYGQTTPTCNGLTATIVATVPGQITGTTGDDIIVGTAGADQIFGLGGNDTICGRGGNDQISGGDGNDNLFGDGGNDTFIWNPGDDNDVVEGSSEIDTLQVNGSGAAENIGISANGNRLRFTRDIANIVLDAAGLERVNFEARGGADLIAVNHLAGTGVQKVTVDLEAFENANTPDGQPDSLFMFGGAGDDQISITGSGNKLSITGTVPAIEILNSEGALDNLSVQTITGNDRVNAQTLDAGLIKLTVEGGPGNDTLTGSRGADALAGGEDNDTFVWTVGLPADLIGGEAGTDTLQVLGSAAADKIDLWATATGVAVSNTVANVGFEADVEQVLVQAGRGADQIFVGAVAGSALQQVTLDLKPTITATAGDGYADALLVHGTNGVDNISISGSTGSLTISGLAPAIVVQGAEGSRDTLTVNSGADADVLNAQGLAAGVIRLTLRGGSSSDTLTGSLGNDLFPWSPGDGNDVIEGGLGTDTLEFSGANIGEKISLTASGSRLRFTRDIANIVMDVNGVERVTVAVVGGADTITIGDLGPSSVRQVALNLGALGNSAGDAQPDTIQITSLTTGPISTAIGAGTMTITWLPVKITVTGVEPVNDRFILQTPAAAPSVISSIVDREIAANVNVDP